MADIVETPSFDEGIYLIELADPVQGGPTGINNKQGIALANRTRWLKDQVTTIFAALASAAGLNSPEFTGTPRGPTASAERDDTQLATVAFVHRNSGAWVAVDVAGNGNKVLTGPQWGHAVVILTGLLTGNINVVFPTRGDRWLVVNRTTGLFEVNCKTAAGQGVKVAQGRSKSVFCDGTDLLDEETDLSQRWRRVTAATTAAPGDLLVIDQSGGAFATTMPANPSAGDRVGFKGNFKSANHTVARNGQKFYDKDGVPKEENLILNRNHVTIEVVFDGVAWQV